MRYASKYPDAARDSEPQPKVIQSGRFYPCDNQECQEPTPWRMVAEATNHEMPCCSEECHAILRQQYKDNP